MFKDHGGAIDKLFKGCGGEVDKILEMFKGCVYLLLHHDP